MAIYVYHCTSCNNDFEVIKPMSKSDDVSSCPKCNSTETKKKILTSTIIYRGSGFTKQVKNE